MRKGPHWHQYFPFLISWSSIQLRNPEINPKWPNAIQITNDEWGSIPLFMKLNPIRKHIGELTQVTKWNPNEPKWPNAIQITNDKRGSIPLLMKLNTITKRIGVLTQATKYNPDP